MSAKAYKTACCLTTSWSGELFLGSWELAMHTLTIIVNSAGYRSDRIEIVLVMLKHRKRAVIGTHALHPLARVLDHVSGLEHQLLNHRTNSSSLRRLVQRQTWLMQSVLPHQVQQIHDYHRQCIQQIVRIELARRQAHAIHVHLELKMKLLMCELIGQSGAPAVQHMLGQQHILTLFGRRCVRSTHLQSAAYQGARPAPGKNFVCPDRLPVGSCHQLPHRCVPHVL